MKDIIASMTTYNEKPEMLDRAVKCFLDTQLEVEIIISDNSPDSLYRGQWKDERVTYIGNGKNLGFAAGHNVAIRESLERGPRYHLVLNPDIYFEAGALEGLFQYMEANREAGLILPRVLYPDGTIQQLYRLLPTPFDLIVRRFLPGPLGKLFKNRIEQYELKGIDLEKEHEIPYLSGCFMFVRAATFKEVGLFDERFFLYMDDVDLSRRFWVKGKNIYYPGVTIIHEHMRESYKTLRFLKYHMKSAVRYFNKWGWFFDRERREINRRAIADILGGEKK